MVGVFALVADDNPMRDLAVKVGGVGTTFGLRTRFVDSDRCSLGTLMCFVDTIDAILHHALSARGFRSVPSMNGESLPRGLKSCMASL